MASCFVSEIFLYQLKDTLARVLGTTAENFSVTELVTKYELDSLMANQIRNWIQSNLSIDYSMMKIMRGPTMEKMTEQIFDGGWRALHLVNPFKFLKAIDDDDVYKEKNITNIKDHLRVFIFRD